MASTSIGLRETTTLKAFTKFKIRLQGELGKSLYNDDVILYLIRARGERNK